ncbi:BlaI/MecI/CopY family transcriptional regulator [Planctomycetota bacterium]
MKKMPRISESQWQIMKLVWAKNPLTANEIIHALSQSTTWNPKTIRTQINRLVKKQVLAFEKKGREYHYYPLVAEQDCIKAESSSFLKRVYGGATKPMLAALLENVELSAEDINELKQILDNKDRS